MIYNALYDNFSMKGAQQDLLTSLCDVFGIKGAIVPQISSNNIFPVCFVSAEQWYARCLFSVASRLCCPLKLSRMLDAADLW